MGRQIPRVPKHPARSQNVHVPQHDRFFVQPSHSEILSRRAPREQAWCTKGEHFSKNKIFLCTPTNTNQAYYLTLLASIKLQFYSLMPFGLGRKTSNFIAREARQICLPNSSGLTVPSPASHLEDRLNHVSCSHVPTGLRRRLPHEDRHLADSLRTSPALSTVPITGGSQKAHIP